MGSNPFQQNEGSLRVTGLDREPGAVLWRVQLLNEGIFRVALFDS